MRYLNKKVVNGREIIEVLFIPMEEVQNLTLVQYLYGWDVVRRKRVFATKRTTVPRDRVQKDL